MTISGTTQLVIVAGGVLLSCGLLLALIVALGKRKKPTRNRDDLSRQASTSSRETCPHCGAPLDMEEAFCRSCGMQTSLLANGQPQRPSFSRSRPVAPTHREGEPGLILLDWDGTIVDDDLRINDDRFAAVLRSKMEQGWLIGLNSDTPMKRLRGWARMLGLNGPLVAERGAVIWWPGKEQRIVSASLPIFSSIRANLVSWIEGADGCALYFGDCTEFIDSVHRIAGNDSAIIAVDAYRKCSLLLFVRTLDSGRLVCDVSLARQVADFVESVRSRNPLISAADLNERQCYVKINALDATKGTGVDHLLRQWDGHGEVFMVGDAIADHLGLPNVQQLAVGNAESAYKSRAARVASHNYAQGCVELLESL